MKPETKLLLRWGGFIAFLLVLIVLSWNVVSENTAKYRTTLEFRKMENISLKLLNDEGESIQFEARVADEEDEQGAGFADIGADVIRQSVILVAYNRDVQVNFSTEQVEAPLDLLFIDGEGNVLKVYQTEAHGTAHYPTEEDSFAFQYVLEAPAGYFEAMNVSNNGSWVDLTAFLIPETEQDS